MATNARAHYLLIWLAWDVEISNDTLVPVRRQIEDLVQLPRKRVTVDVWLESPGGNAHSAYKLALLLKHVAGHVRVVIPDYAKSAATLLALAGNEIYLAPSAELGPLDAQMREEGSVGSISALNIALAADAVAADAVSLAGTGGAQLLRRTGLSRAETIRAMLRFSAQFSEPLVRQLDPKTVHHAKQLLRVTARYAERLLDYMPAARASHVATQLVENFPTHGFVIDYEAAKDLGLPVKRLADYDHLDLVRDVHRFVEDTDFPLIEFTELAQFVQEWEADLDQDDDEETDETDETEEPEPETETEEIDSDGEAQEEDHDSERDAPESGGISPGE